MNLYYFARASTMSTYDFSDDVAIVRAISKKSAIKKFSKLYADIRSYEVYKISYSFKVKILTDY